MNDDIRTRYPQVSDNPVAMALLCKLLRAKGRFDEALALGIAAIETAPDDMEVRDLVGAALSPGIPSWHVPMLNDTARNRCYARAIEKAVRPGMRVLEIGTGAGLPALLAARAGAEVVTCEADPTVAAAARRIIRRNGFDDRITVIAKRSTDLDPDGDLPWRAELLISELFDDTLFGDGVIELVEDARARLIEPGAAILPPRCELRCALVSAPRSEKWKPLDRVEGFDLSPFNILARASAAARRVAAARAELRSDAVAALPMDFAAKGSFGDKSCRIALRSHGGRVDGVAQWLRIDFGDGIVYENDPFAASGSHWGSPIFALPAQRETVPGEVIALSVRLIGSQLLMRLGD